MHLEGENPLDSPTVHDDFLIYRHANSEPEFFEASTFPCLKPLNPQGCAQIPQ